MVYDELFFCTTLIKIILFRGDVNNSDLENLPQVPQHHPGWLNDYWLHLQKCQPETVLFENAEVFWCRQIADKIVLFIFYQDADNFHDELFVW